MVRSKQLAFRLQHFGNLGSGSLGRRNFLAATTSSQSKCQYNKAIIPKLSIDILNNSSKSTPSCLKTSFHHDFKHFSTMMDTKEAQEEDSIDVNSGDNSGNIDANLLIDRALNVKFEKKQSIYSESIVQHPNKFPKRDDGDESKEVLEEKRLPRSFPAPLFAIFSMSGAQYKATEVSK